MIYINKENISKFLDDKGQFEGYDFVYCSEGLTINQVNYIDNCPLEGKSLSRKDFDSFHDSLSVSNRWEYSKIGDMGIPNLLPLLNMRYNPILIDYNNPEPYSGLKVK